MYKCDRCDKNFNQKIDFDRHKLRKNPCAIKNRVSEQIINETAVIKDMMIKMMEENRTNAERNQAIAEENPAILEKYQIMFESLQDRIIKLENKGEDYQKRVKTNNDDNMMNNNGDIMNNNCNIINNNEDKCIVSFGKEDLTNDQIKDILG